MLNKILFLILLAIHKPRDKHYPKELDIMVVIRMSKSLKWTGNLPGNIGSLLRQWGSWEFEKWIFRGAPRTQKIHTGVWSLGSYCLAFGKNIIFKNFTF